MHFLPCPNDNLTLPTFAKEISEPTSFIISVMNCCISRTDAGTGGMYNAAFQV
jgi:hypothetical protein